MQFIGQTRHRINVKNGTPSSHTNESLCLSCKNGISATTNMGKQYIKCYSFDNFVNEKIIKCSDYAKRGEPDLYEFEKLAWTLQTDKNRGPIGFQPPPRNDT